MSHFYDENPPATWEDCGQCGGCHPPAKDAPKHADLATALYEGDCRCDIYRWPSPACIAALIANPLPGDAADIEARQKHERLRDQNRQ